MGASSTTVGLSAKYLVSQPLFMQNDEESSLSDNQYWTNAETFNSTWYSYWRAVASLKKTGFDSKEKRILPIFFRSIKVVRLAVASEVVIVMFIDIVFEIGGWFCSQWRYIVFSKQNKVRVEGSEEKVMKVNLFSNDLKIT